MNRDTIQDFLFSLLFYSNNNPTDYCKSFAKVIFLRNNNNIHY